MSSISYLSPCGANSQTDVDRLRAELGQPPLPTLQETLDGRGVGTPPVVPGVDSARCIHDAMYPPRVGPCSSSLAGEDKWFLAGTDCRLEIQLQIRDAVQLAISTYATSPSSRGLRRVVIAGIRALSTRRDAIFGSLFLVPCSLLLPSFLSALFASFPRGFVAAAPPSFLFAYCLFVLPLRFRFLGASRLSDACADWVAGWPLATHRQWYSRYIMTAAARYAFPPRPRTYWALCPDVLPLPRTLTRAGWRREVAAPLRRDDNEKQPREQGHGGGARAFPESAATANAALPVDLAGRPAPGRRCPRILRPSSARSWAGAGAGASSRRHRARFDAFAAVICGAVAVGELGRNWFALEVYLTERRTAGAAASAGPSNLAQQAVNMGQGAGQGAGGGMEKKRRRGAGSGTTANGTGEHIVAAGGEDGGGGQVKRPRGRPRGSRNRGGAPG
ncbi:hypothetical protein B0H14DRAFT_3885155 [Mycena olivaceomarginata]|nr:hypothetical protein B0H14DRAFT_3885155 [Mycena olivaceomarginata]